MPDSSSRISMFSRGSTEVSPQEVTKLLLEPGAPHHGTNGQHDANHAAASRVNGRVIHDPAEEKGPKNLGKHTWYGPVKRAIDIVTAVLLAVPVLPLILLAALLVKLSSRGPAFYSQVRLGRQGRPFKIYKIRTMSHECESLSGPRWSVPGDPRITRIGALLRRRHVDELPQLLNVICGQMSLIGPRPERPEFLPLLVRALPTYRQRLQVRPGVTGLAQVQLPADTDLVSVRRKLIYDLYYIRRMNPWLDLQILLCTILYAATVPFRWSRKLFRVPSSEQVEKVVAVPLVSEAAALTSVG